MMSMSTVVPPKPNLTTFDYLSTNQVAELLKANLRLLEELTPYLGQFVGEATNQLADSRHSVDVHKTIALNQLLEEISLKKAETLDLRIKLHMLLFGLGVEARQERGLHGYSTMLSSEQKLGDLPQALELLATPSVFVPQDDESEEPSTRQSDLPLF